MSITWKKIPLDFSKLNDNLVYESDLWEDNQINSKNYDNSKENEEEELQEQNFKRYTYKLFTNANIIRIDQDDNKYVESLYIDSIYIAKKNQNIKDFAYCIILAHDILFTKDIIRLFSKNEDEITNWFDHLKYHCIQQNLEKDFIFIQKICEHKRMTVSKSKSKVTTNKLDKHQNGSQLYAIKTYKIEEREVNTSVGNTMKAEIRKEINLCKILKHPLIPNFITTYEESDCITRKIHLVFEWIEGQTLLEYIKLNKKLDEIKAAGIMKSLFQVLAFMHDRRIIHNDIKPSNILISHGNKQGNELSCKVGDSRLKNAEIFSNIRVIDFNISTFADEIVINQEEVSGTPGFIAPEILAGRIYDEKADIFSAGIMLYVMLTGSIPYNKSHDKDAIIEQNFRHKLRFNGFEWEMLSNDAKNMIKKLTAFNPVLRYSAQEALESRWIIKNSMERSIIRNNSNDISANTIPIDQKYILKPKQKLSIDCLSSTNYSFSQIVLSNNRFSKFEIKLTKSNLNRENESDSKLNDSPSIKLLFPCTMNNEADSYDLNIEDSGLYSLNYNINSTPNYFMNIKKKPLQHYDY